MPKSATKPATPKYRRILLKLSGEALRTPGSHETISPEIVQQMAEDIQMVHTLGVEIGIVIGGGNIWRGLSASHRGMERTTADYMGMLATVINGLALQSTLEALGLPDPRADGHPHGHRRGVLHPAQGGAPSGAGPHRHFRRGHGESVLLAPIPPPRCARMKSARM